MYLFFLFLLTVFLLLAGLSFLALRRRNEILRNYLTTREQDLEEEEFFRRVPRKPEATEVPTAEDEQADNTIPTADDVQWGTPG